MMKTSQKVNIFFRKNQNVVNLMILRTTTGFLTLFCSILFPFSLSHSTLLLYTSSKISLALL